MTDAITEAGHTQGPSVSADADGFAAPAPAEDPTAFGWLNTVDHKRIGRLFIACSLLFGLAGTIADLLVRFDLTSSGGHTVLNGDSFVQVFTFTRDALVFGMLIPLFLGIAVYVVPLQVGAPNVAFGRAAALSFWGWLVSAGVLVGAYIANGGPGGGFADGVDLHLLAVAGLVISLLTGAICVAVTTLTMRAPGMYMDRTPPFAWSALVTASMLVVSLGVVLGQIVILYIEHRYGPRFLGGNYGIWSRIDWMYRTPQLFIYVVPVLGVVAEIMLAAARRWVFEPLALYFTMGLVGLFGFGAWANFGITDEGADIVDGLEGIVLVGLYAGALAGVSGLLALLGFTVWQGRNQPRPGSGTLSLTRPNTALAAAFVAGTLVAAAALVGLVGAGVDWLQIADRGVDGNAPLRFTTWVTGQQSLLIYGAGLLGGLAALHWWAPKIWGRRLSELAGWASLLAIGGGALLAWLGPTLSGVLTEQPQFVYGDPLLTTRYADQVDDTGASVAEGLSTVGAIGVVIVLAGVVLVVLNLLVSVSMRKGAPAESDPWGGLTPEWLLDSPPPLGPSETLPELASGTPLLDLEFNGNGLNGSGVAADRDAHEVPA
ncbi:cbb3-type cytochrome c oxidase subunit I [Candidatus Poriferisodalis sp.]|uniref:cbb3-type cytochrome c oxidase subunit I n=1 Tax=Candidatus Poriferisodalis sp. TaxID=3101277 RepID=UPI003B02CB6D